MAKAIATKTIAKRARENKMDSAIKRIRANSEAKIAGIQLDIEEKTKALEVWATENPEAFGDSKTLEMTHAILSFRTGNPRLEMIKGVESWEDVLKRIDEASKIFEKLTGYVDTKRSVNQQALLTDRGAISEMAMNAIGLVVVQDERFHVKPKVTKQDSGKQTVVSSPEDKPAVAAA